MHRHLIERERRSNMNNLYSKLFSLLPPQPTKMSITDMLELATLHVKQLQRQVEELKQGKMELEEESEACNRVKREMVTPVLDVTDSNSIMRVNLIYGSDLKFTLGDIISITEEEGAEVVTATYSHAEKLNRNILSIHCQAICSRIGIDSSRVRERLKTLMEECM